MKSVTRDKILVTGGSGFLGREICRVANEWSLQVISLSKSGKPDDIKDDEFKNVSWQAANIFAVDSWKESLRACYAVIHCIGIIEEHRDQDIPYENLILGSAMLIGNVARDLDVKKLVYISAGAAAPETPAAYMKNKRAAEHYLSSLTIDLTILRPGMLYGPQRPETVAENEIIQKLLHDPQVYPGLKENRPLPVRTVAVCALEAALGRVQKPVLSVDDMEDEARATLQ